MLCASKFLHDRLWITRQTCPYNPIDLQHSHSHRSDYTCLSCSASAEGTPIVQSFQPSVITGGCSRWLRQEFCDLELMALQVTQGDYLLG